MKQNKYFKAKLTADTSEELLNNPFVVYLAVMVGLANVAFLQKEFNLISISCLTAIGVLVYRMAYQLGINSKS